MQEKMNEQYQQQQAYSPQPDTQPSSKAKTSSNDYIDFEEVK